MLLFLIMLSFLLLAGWQMAAAGPTNEFTGHHPAQAQVLGILPSLQSSEAEKAAGAYVPTVGAVLTLDLLRGPNVHATKPAAEATRDWGIYLMQTFGEQLDAIGDDESVAFSINYYDYELNTFRQLVISADKFTVDSAETYRIWLDGRLWGDSAE